MKIVSLLLFAILIAGCTQAQTQVNNNTTAAFNDNTTAQASENHIVTIKDFAFNPQVLTIKLGDSVTWVNEDSSLHIVASNPHPTHTDLPGLIGDVAPGANYTFTFSIAGTWGYHCHVHPAMTGTVIVE